MNRFGGGLVTLLMFAMGLGCLNVVFQGLFDGSLSGAKGATFSFASKPVKFVLIELFWVSFGLTLLLGAWRGASRQESDDEQDHDDGVTQPVRLPVEELRTASGVSSKSESDLSRHSQDMPIAINGNLDVAPKSAVPIPLELYPSRFYAILVFVLFTIFAISSAFTAVALTNIFGKALVVMMVAPIVLVYLKTVAQCLRNFFWTGPVLVLDKFGITNYRKGGHLIPWTQVDAVRLDAVYSATYLILRFRHSSDVNTHFGKTRWLQSITGHLFYKGFEGRVKLTSLVFTRSVVLRKAQDLLRNSRR